MILLALAALTACDTTSPGDTTDTVDTNDTTVVSCTDDLDADGSNACDDCDDNNAAVHPGAAEVCDGLDDNCDGVTDPSDVDVGGVLACQTCADAGFFDVIANTPDDGLRAALHTATDGVNCSYNGSRQRIFSVIDKVDSTVTCVYTGRVYPDTSYPPDNWQHVNTEHTWPQSMGADADPAQCDIHHLFPVGVDVNTARGNVPFGEVVDVQRNSDSGGSWNGSALGDDAHGTQVFEPRDAHKGNVARAMLYFRVRYDDQLASNEIAALASSEDLVMYDTWDVLDPVDDTEIARSLAIAAYEGHANPFVVCPGLVERYTQAER